MSEQDEINQLREEVAMVETQARGYLDKIARLEREISELRKTPAIPESAIRAVWEEGYITALANSYSSLGEAWAESKGYTLARFAKELKRGGTE